MKNFILTSTIKPSTCDRLIDLYESGLFTEGEARVDGGILDDQLDAQRKKCKESYYAHNAVLFYLKELKKVLNKYKKEYPWSSNGCRPWGVHPFIKIQKYLPGEAYFLTHYENNGTPDSVNRHLAFMTYLNTVRKGGETEWPSQELKLKPKKGLTSIWPAHFTHPHLGIPAPVETKYVITGWYCFE